MGITAALIFLNPYFGAAWSSTLSFAFGSYVGVLAAWVVTQILGTQTIMITNLDDPYQPKIGWEGDPSPVGTGILLFIGNFLIAYVAASFMWIKGAHIIFNVLILIWYAQMKNPFAEKLDFLDFSKIGRTAVFGCVVGIIWLVVPFPKWHSPVRGTPASRYSIPVILDQLRGASQELEHVFTSLVMVYQQLENHSLLDSLIPQLEVILSTAESKLKVAASLLGSSAQWEPVLSPYWLKFSSIQKYYATLDLMVIQCRALLVTMKNPLPGNYKWDAIDDELLILLTELSDLASKSMQAGRKHFSASTNFRSAIELQLQRIREKMGTIFQDITIEPHITEEGKQRAYECNCLWKLYNISTSIISLEHILANPSGPGFFSRGIFDWGFLYLEMWKASLREIHRVLCCKESFRKFCNRRYTWFIGSLQISIAALIGALFVLITHLRERIPSGYVVVATIVIIMDRDNYSTQFSKGENRLTGTALAIAGAFFISALWPDGNDWAILIVVSIYGGISRFIQCNPLYSYTMFSFMVVLFGVLFEISPDPIKVHVISSTNGRGTATAIGVVIACFCNLLWPFRGRSLIRYQFAKNQLKNLLPLIQGTFNIFDKSPETTEPLVTKYLARYNKNILAQSTILIGAVTEPLLWRDPFPLHAWNNVIECQKNLFLSAATAEKISFMFLKRSFEADPSAIHRVFGVHSEDWCQLTEEISFRIYQATLAVESNSCVIPFSRTLEEHLFDWILAVKQRAAEENLPNLSHVLLWAMVWNCSLLVKDLTRLCAAIDQLHITIQETKEPGISFGRLPSCSKSMVFYQV